MAARVDHRREGTRVIILGIDSSLTSTGLAWLDTDEVEWSTDRVRTVPNDQSLADRWSRMQRIGREVKDMAFASPVVDLAVIEGLATYGHNAGLLAGLWWQIVGPLAAADVEVLVVPPATRAKYAAGKGNAGKSDVLARVRETYPAANVPDHNVADGVALAALGARVKGFPVEQVARSWVEDVAAAVAVRAQEKEQ